MVSNDVKSIVLLVGISIISLYSSGCAQEEPMKEKQGGDTEKIANPAAQKCVKDGYSLEPIMENGVPIGYFCVNQVSSQRCEIWRNFRGECRLD